MQKRILVIVLLSALLLTVGCAEHTETSDAASSDTAASFAESAQSSETVISLPEETTHEESSDSASSEVIELPAAPEFALRGGLLFCPDEGWEETGEHVYTSADGTCTVRADFLTMPDPKNITETLLVSDAVQTLPDALAQAGAEIVSLESVTLDFLGMAHPAVSLATSKNGKTVYQHQIYLLNGADVLLLTVTTQTEDKRDTLWSYFKEN